MTEEKREYLPDTGILFPNKAKREDRQPDYIGSGNHVCEACGNTDELFISGWRNVGQRGNYLKLKFGKKEER